MSVETPTLEDEEIDVMPPPETGGSKFKRIFGRIFALFLVFAICYGAYRVYKNWQASQAAALQAATMANSASVPVVVQPVRRGDIRVYLNGLGNVTAFNTVTIKSRVDGQLINVAFKEGEFINKGDLLAELDPRPFQVQLAQAEGALAHDQAQLNNAKLDLTRYQRLATTGVIPVQQLDTQVATVSQFEGLIKTDQANVDNAKLQLVYCRITAPISGKIGLRLVDVGNIVHAADTTGLLVITQVEPISVLFTIPEDNLPAVLKRLSAGEHPAVEAYDRSGTTKIATGTLLTLDNQIDPTTGTSRLKAVFDNKDKALFPNEFVNARLLLQVKQSRLLIPAPAIQRGPEGTYVYVINNESEAEDRKVKVGTIEGSDAEIDEGLAEGEVVVVDGVDKLTKGSQVQISAPGKHYSGTGKAVDSTESAPASTSSPSTQGAPPSVPAAPPAFTNGAGSASPSSNPGAVGSSPAASAAAMGTSPSTSTKPGSRQK
ncbi:MAG TPA: MdtA/MuxA family multidrug efflux RND transporter periplasmic adaptor subunit [Blastocatellia bacterium]